MDGNSYLKNRDFGVFFFLGGHLFFLSAKKNRSQSMPLKLGFQITQVKLLLGLAHSPPPFSTLFWKRLLKRPLLKRAKNFGFFFLNNEKTKSPMGFQSTPPPGSKTTQNCISFFFLGSPKIKGDPPKRMPSPRLPNIGFFLGNPMAFFPLNDPPLFRK